jgi:hypothetical protein
LLTCGCGAKGDAKLAGDWHGTFEGAGSSIPGGDLNLNEEGKFRIVLGNLVYEGSWSSSETTVTLQPEKINNMTIEEAKRKVNERGSPQQKEMFRTISDPIPLTVGDGGKTLTSQTVAGGHTVYRRS